MRFNNLDGLRDAFTGAALEPSRGLMACPNCGVYYHLDSVECVKTENSGNCVSCGDRLPDPGGRRNQRPRRAPTSPPTALNLPQQTGGSKAPLWIGGVIAGLVMLAYLGSGTDTSTSDAAEAPADTVEMPSAQPAPTLSPFKELTAYFVPDGRRATVFREASSNSVVAELEANDRMTADGVLTLPDGTEWVSVKTDAGLSGYVKAADVNAQANEHPSFSCLAATSLDEFMICQSDALGKKDRKMAGLYQKTLLSLGENFRPALRREQQHWLASRQECSALLEPQACLNTYYDDRIAQLTPMDDGDDDPYQDDGQPDEVAPSPQSPIDRRPSLGVVSVDYAGGGEPHCVIRQFGSSTTYGDFDLQANTLRLFLDGRERLFPLERQYGRAARTSVGFGYTVSMTPISLQQGTGPQVTRITVEGAFGTTASTYQVVCS